MLAVVEVRHGIGNMCGPQFCVLTNLCLPVLTWEWVCACLGMGLCSPGNGFVLAWEWICAHLGMSLCSPGNGFVLAWEWVCACLGMGLCLPGNGSVLAWESTDRDQ